MIRRVSALLVSALAFAVLPAAPAVASTTGNVVFSCSLEMSDWPGASGHGECHGTSTVSVSGFDDTGTAYTVGGPGAFHMTFDYSAACIAAEPPLLWSGFGQIEVGPVLAVRGGTVTQATLTADVSIVGTLGSYTFTTTRHRVVFPDATIAFGATGLGEASMAMGPGATNRCPVGGRMSASVNGSWHLAV